MSALPPRYQRLERIAAGGMSDVFRATDTHLARTVAVKLLAGRFCADVEAQRRFVREGRAAARLSGEPHTITVYDVGEWAGRPYIVMEYLPGGSLADLLRADEGVSAEQALRWVADAGQALDYAHARGVIHRDVKPGNLLVDADGAVVVADYGIATAVGLDAVTLTGTVLGTAGYLAPEQAQGRPATAASDRYGLAVVAYELLAGSRPFNGTSIAAGALAQLHDPLPPASGRNPQLPDTVDRVFERALAVDPASRFSSCGAFAAELRRSLASAPARQDAEPTLVVAPRPRSRRRLAWLLTALGVLALAGALAAVWLSRGGQPAAAPAVTVVVTAPPRTVTELATSPPPAPTTTPSAGSALLTQGESLLQRREYLQALPLFQQANREFNASGTPDEARADADLALAIVGVGSCNGVISLIDRVDQLTAAPPQTDRLRALCSHAPGHGQGHGHGRGGGEQ